MLLNMSKGMRYIMYLENSECTAPECTKLTSYCHTQQFKYRHIASLSDPPGLKEISNKEQSPHDPHIVIMKICPYHGQIEYT